jgi:serine/threonine protein kinase
LLELFLEPFLEPLLELFLEPFLEPLLELFLEPFLEPLLEPLLELFLESFYCQNSNMQGKRLVKNDGFHNYNISIGEKIGAGSFGIVYKGILSNNDGMIFDVAVKDIVINPKDVKEFDFLINELEVLMILGKNSQRNDINGYYDYIFDKESLNLYLMTILQKNKIDLSAIDYKSFDEKNIIHIMLNIARAVQYVHSLHVAHRDIKPSNIMIDPMTADITLIDFGLSCMIQKCKKYTQGSYPYISPEEFSGLYLSPDQFLKSDIFSLGAVFYHLANNKHVYSNLDGLKDCDNIVCLGHKIQQNKKEFTSNHKNHAINVLIDQMIRIDLNKRLNINEIVDILNNIVYTDVNKYNNQQLDLLKKQFHELKIKYGSDKKPFPTVPKIIKLDIDEENDIMEKLDAWDKKVNTPKSENMVHIITTPLPGVPMLGGNNKINNYDNYLHNKRSYIRLIKYSDTINQSHLT